MDYKSSDYFDYEDAYNHALRIISRQACSSGLLKEKLLKTTTKDITEQVIKEILAQNLLDDYTLCENTANMWIQHKPLSINQLYQRLSKNGFKKSDIQETIRALEHSYTRGEIAHVGGYSKEILRDHYRNFSALSLPSALACAACLYMQKISVKSLSAHILISRLQMRGYIVDSSVQDVIAQLCPNTKS